ncbi:MAG: hypothetical protein JWM07_695 [Candidatus Saccharibacteria bacterium]|jgi:hypothetical protein|nr:hypothetical protein [Candidatus Saccharibacteria bacterium]
MAKKNWLARLDEIDQKAQARLDKDNNSDIKTLFKKSKTRSRKPNKEETTLKLATFVYGFFLLEVCTLAGLSLGPSATQDSGSSIGSDLQLFVWLAMLAIASVAIGIVALVKRPRLFYMHIPLLLNSFIVAIILLAKLPV